MEDIVNKDIILSLKEKFGGRDLTLNELGSVVEMSSFETISSRLKDWPIS
jgi:hypothetical protein